MADCGEPSDDELRKVPPDDFDGLPQPQQDRLYDIDRKDISELVAHSPLYACLRRPLCYSHASPRLPKKLHFECRRCGCPQTFSATAQLALVSGGNSWELISNTGNRQWEVAWAAYNCHMCGHDERHFLLRHDGIAGTLTKIGQYPPWEIKGDTAVSKLLGDDAVYYKRALICMSQSYGVAAHAYLRRIVENSMGKILAALLQELETSGADPGDIQTVKDAISSRRGGDKAAAIGEACPVWLRPGGQNPFGMIYSELSAAIHALDEEQCMASATTIKTCIEYIVKTMASQRKEREAFTSGLREVSGTRAARMAAPRTGADGAGGDKPK